MRVLIVGGGGREHALAWKLKEENPVAEVIAAPGNPGIAALGECVSIAVTDIAALAALARDRAVDLTVVGPEGPLERGIVDAFREAGLAVFGPTRAAAEIETSKAFAKQLMLDDGIPTARAEMHTSPTSAKSAAQRFGAPVVIKASGLASGKGVIVCETIEAAEAAIDDMLEGGRFGDAGHEVLVEEFMEGEELSVFAITDGTSFLLLPGLQDHKRLLDRDLGPNTGGMGAYVPVSLPVNNDEIADIVERTLRGMRDRGRPFTGLLYAGLMITHDGAKVVEFNCRFGDPETQALLPVLSTQPGLFAIMHAVATGRPFPNATVELRGASVATVLAAANYPDAPRTGDSIAIPVLPEGVTVFHAGTGQSANGQLVTAGGRVLAVSAVGSSTAEARARSLAFAEQIRFDGKQLRTDIGWRESARASGN